MKKEYLISELARAGISTSNGKVKTGDIDKLRTTLKKIIASYDKIQAKLNEVLGRGDKYSDYLSTFNISPALENTLHSLELENDVEDANIKGKLTERAAKLLAETYKQYSKTASADNDLNLAKKMCEVEIKKVADKYAKEISSDLKINVSAEILSQKSMYKGGFIRCTLNLGADEVKFDGPHFYGAKVELSRHMDQDEKTWKFWLMHDLSPHKDDEFIKNWQYHKTASSLKNMSEDIEDTGFHDKVVEALSKLLKKEEKIAATLSEENKNFKYIIANDFGKFWGGSKWEVSPSYALKFRDIEKATACQNKTNGTIIKYNFKKTDAIATNENYAVKVSLSYPTFGITSTGEEMEGTGHSTLEFKYLKEEDAEQAKKVAEDFEYTEKVEVKKGTGQGYSVFKKDAFLIALKKTVDPQVGKTSRMYYRGRRRY